MKKLHTDKTRQEKLSEDAGARNEPDLSRQGSSTFASASAGVPIFFFFIVS